MDGDATPIPERAGEEAAWPSPRATPQQVAALGADEHLDQLLEQVHKRRRELSQPTQPAAMYELATPAQVEASQASQRSRASRAEGHHRQPSRGRRQRRSASRSPRAPGHRSGSLVADTYLSGDDAQPPALVAPARRRQALEQQCMQAKVAAAADAADTARQQHEARQLALACQATARMAAAGAAEARAARQRGTSSL